MKTAANNKYKKADPTDKFSSANDPLGLERFFQKNTFRHSDAIVNKSLECIFSAPSTGIIENLSATIDAEQTRNFTAEELFNYHSDGCRKPEAKIAPRFKILL